MPAGIFGSGFEDQIARRRKEKNANTESLYIEKGDGDDNDTDKGDDLEVIEIVGDASTFRGTLYNFFHLQNGTWARVFEMFINVLIIGSSITFMFDTMFDIAADNDITKSWHTFFRIFEIFTVLIFTVEYSLRLYSATEDPKFRGSNGIIRHAQRFLSVVDLLAILPFWIDMVFIASDNSSFTTLVAFLRLLRLLHFEKYMKAFTFFDDVIRENSDILSVTGFSAVLLW